MEFFKIAISETAERLNFDSLSEEERAALFKGVAHDPDTHDIFRILVAVVERDPPAQWSERQKQRKRYALVDRALLDMRPRTKQIRIAGLFPASIAGDGSRDFDLEAQAGAKIMDVANATLRFSGPIKTWWRKRRPQVAANRTDRLAQWVFSREWIDGANQCLGELLCEVPKGVAEHARTISCYCDFKSRDGRAVEKARRLVRLP